jgi:hypothetical protein
MGFENGAISTVNNGVEAYRPAPSLKKKKSFFKKQFSIIGLKSLWPGFSIVGV